VWDQINIKRFFCRKGKCNLYLHSLFGGISSAGSEHLPYKQRVGGSNPSSPTKQKPVAFVTGFYF
jgi:hypothetical protein